VAKRSKIEQNGSTNRMDRSREHGKGR
jgi:hypothetical protein